MISLTCLRFGHFTKEYKLLGIRECLGCGRKTDSEAQVFNIKGES